MTHELITNISNFLADKKKNNLLRTIKEYIPLENSHVKVEHNKMINISSNDYLGFSFHEEVIQASMHAIGKYGVGACASRLVSGSFDLHKIVESKLARLKNRQACLLFSTGFQCNSTVIPALCNPKIASKSVLIISDKLIHASILHGIQASGKHVSHKRYNHNDMTHLARILEKYAQDFTTIIIISESVFSMDGDLAPLDELIKLKNTHKALLYIDEAHSTGVLGENGAGLCHNKDVDIIMGTLSKAFSSMGAYIVGSQALIDYLTNANTGFIYSTALSPAMLGAINKILDLLPTAEIQKRRENLQAKAHILRTSLQDLEINTSNSQSQIVPMIIGTAEDTLKWQEYFKNNNFIATAIRPPTVPQGGSRIRFALNSALKDQDLEELIHLIKAGMTNTSIINASITNTNKKGIL